MKSRAWVDAFCGSRATLYQRIARIAAPAIYFGTLILIAVRWRVLPEQIPSHYNFAGEIDGWSGRGMLFIMPAIGILVDITFIIVERFPQSWNTGVRLTVFNRVWVYRVLRDMMADLRLGMAVLFTFMSVWLSFTPDYFPGGVVAGITAAAVLIPVIRYFVRVKRAG